jgi:hypothetical protein
MPVRGLVRLRKHQFGRQQDWGTKVPATRAYPFKGVPEHDLNWVDPDVDAGSLDPTVAPHREVPNLSASLNYPQLGYNDLPLLLCGFFGGQVSPTGGGTAKTWTHEPSSTELEGLDPFVYEFGDDALDDWFQDGNGVVESFDVTIPPGLTAVTVDSTWKFGSVSSTGSTDSPVDGTVPTPDLAVDTNPAIVYGKDLSVYIADSVAGLAAGQIVDAFHGGVMHFAGDLDEKRYANGSQTFDVDEFVRATRAISFEMTFAKTADIVGVGSESDHWMADQAVDRYIQFKFLSTALAQTPSTFNEWTLTAPCRYYTRTEGDEGGNSTVVLTGHAFFDPEDLELVLRSVLVNTLSEAELGLAGS